MRGRLTHATPRGTVARADGGAVPDTAPASAPARLRRGGGTVKGKSPAKRLDKRARGGLVGKVGATQGAKIVRRALGGSVVPKKKARKVDDPFSGEDLDDDENADRKRGGRVKRAAGGPTDKPKPPSFQTVPSSKQRSDEGSDVAMDEDDGAPLDPVPLPKPKPVLPKPAAHAAVDIKDRAAGGGISIKPSHKGLLHKDLDVASGSPIPAEKLAKAKNSGNPAVRKRAVFAANAKKWNH